MFRMPVTQGSSGGPVFNEYGEVISMINYGYTPGDYDYEFMRSGGVNLTNEYYRYFIEEYKK